MDKLNWVVIVGASIFTIGFAIIIYDSNIITKSAEQDMYDFYMKSNISGSCENLKEEVDRYNNTILTRPPDYIKRAYNDKCLGDD